MESTLISDISKKKKPYEWVPMAVLPSEIVSLEGT